MVVPRMKSRVLLSSGPRTDSRRADWVGGVLAGVTVALPVDEGVLLAVSCLTSSFNSLTSDSSWVTRCCRFSGEADGGGVGCSGFGTCAWTEIAQAHTATAAPRWNHDRFAGTVRALRDHRRNGILTVQIIDGIKGRRFM